MQTAPVIIVQLIHIEGPLKGQIVELADPVIKIGRHPSCQLKYPADLAIISREHAVITREGNRFKLTDHSSNGTIVNGRRITEIFLKDGDVITVSEGGPKVSFLTQITDKPFYAQEKGSAPPAAKTPNVPPPQPPQPVQPSQPPQPVQSARPVQSIQPVQPSQPAPTPAEPKRPLKNRVPLIIQYGPTLRSFDELPLTIGKHPGSGFCLDHESILDMHAEIYFADEQYWIRDLTGRQMITVNNIPVDQGRALNANDGLAFSQTGPFFRFLGNGRLSEEERESQEEIPQAGNSDTEKSTAEKSGKKPLSFFKKVFSKL